MKFLIIGASGFIGQHIMAHMRAMGYETAGTRLHSHPEQGLIEFDLAHDRFLDKFPASFFKDGGPMFVVFCAGLSKIDHCFREPAATRVINVTHTLRIMEDATALGARPIFLSSSAVFDGRDGGYTDDSPLSPLSEYGRQKAEIESFYHQHHPDWLLLRLDKIVGDDPTENHLFTEWYRWLRAGQPIVCMDKQMFSPTCVDDIAQAIILGCRKGLTGLYNVSNNERWSRDGLALQFLKILDREAPVMCKSQYDLGFVEQRPEKSWLDARRFVRETGMRFTTMRQVITKFKATTQKNKAG